MPLNIKPVLNGTYASEIQATLDIVVKACNNETDPNRPCAPQKEIDEFIASNSPFYLTPFFYNPLINPQSY
jgi:hypothetical protein